MKIKLLIAAQLIFNLSIAQSTAVQDSIKATINTFFDGMHKKDTALVRSTVTSSINMQTIQRNSKGEVKVVNVGIEGFLNQIITLPASVKKLEERITFDNILIDTDMASAWTPFTLYINDELYSCGVNNFQLVRINNVWKINFIIDTRRKTCK